MSVRKLEELPDETAPDRAFFEGQHVQATLAVPLTVDSRFLGVAVYSSTDPRDWPESTERELRLFGEMLANAYERFRRMSALARSEQELRAALSEIEKLRDRLQEENVQLREEIRTAQGFGRIVGNAPALRRCLGLVAKVAPTDATVLIPGQTGTGKELLALVVIALVAGVDPLPLLDSGLDTGVGSPATNPGVADEGRDFVSAILGSTEETWGEIFQSSGELYREPALVLFSGSTPSACGTGQAAMGPFYCPRDESVYIDLSFYDDLTRRFQAPGDFAQAYVIAHEVGHHVQNLLGAMEQVDQLRGLQSEVEANAVSVRLELQADCYAGVWGYHADRMQQVLEYGDVEEALTAAAALGDDRLQQQSQGVVVPESFTHGTSAERVRWFRQGLESGRPNLCDTFGATP